MHVCHNEVTNNSAHEKPLLQPAGMCSEINQETKEHTHAARHSNGAPGHGCVPFIPSRLLQFFDCRNLLTFSEAERRRPIRRPGLGPRFGGRRGKLFHFHK